MVTFLDNSHVVDKLFNHCFKVCLSKVNAFSGSQQLSKVVEEDLRGYCEWTVRT